MIYHWIICGKTHDSNPCKVGKHDRDTSVIANHDPMCFIVNVATR